MSEVTETFIETAAMCDSSEAAKAYAQLRASLESLGLVKNLIGDFLYTDIGYMGDETAAAMSDAIRMRMGFIREAVGLVNPSLDVIEQYLTTLMSGPDNSGD